MQLAAQAPRQAPAAKGPAAKAAAVDPAKTKIIESVDTKFQTYDSVQKQIWGFAEVGYQEEKSSALLQSQLKAAGFTVQTGVADEPTAFVASYGSGKPVIGSSGNSTRCPACRRKRQPRDASLSSKAAPGTACGHHLYGVGSAAAGSRSRSGWRPAAARARSASTARRPKKAAAARSTWCAPASTRTWMPRSPGIPGDRNEAGADSNAREHQRQVPVPRRSSHAAAAPDRGRSALDAVEAMDYMVNMMREHVPQETRIHYIITQRRVRAEHRPRLRRGLDILRPASRHAASSTASGQRIINAAKAAALGTGTTMDFEMIARCYNVLPNDYLSDVQQQEPPDRRRLQYTPEEQAFAEKIAKTLPLIRRWPRRSGRRRSCSLPGQASRGASTDMGDVSWVVADRADVGRDVGARDAGAQLAGRVASGGTSIGAKGMMVAAKTMALTAMTCSRRRSTFRRPGRSSTRDGASSPTRRRSATASRRLITGSSTRDAAGGCIRAASVQL